MIIEDMGQRAGGANHYLLIAKYKACKFFFRIPAAHQGGTRGDEDTVGRVKYLRPSSLASQSPRNGVHLRGGRAFCRWLNVPLCSHTIP